MNKSVRNFVRIRICNWSVVLYLDSYRDYFDIVQDFDLLTPSGYRQGWVDSVDRSTCYFVRDNEKRQYRMDFLISDDGEKEIDSETERKQIWTSDLASISTLKLETIELPLNSKCPLNKIVGQPTNKRSKVPSWAFLKFNSDLI